MKEGKTLDNSYNEDEKYTQNKIVQAIVEKCDFYYDDALLSKETIIVEYLKFLAGQFKPNEKTISFAFHTGSKCFDMVALPALLIGSLFYGFSSNEEIIRNLEIGQMVIYKNRKSMSKRYRFKGLGFDKIDNKEQEIIYLEEDNKDRGKFSLIFEKNKHLITPYYGKAEKTGGQGVKKISEYRADFISYILDIQIEDVPTKFDYSFVMVAHKDYIINLCKRIKIKYQNKMVGLTDIVPISYYTSGSGSLKIGSSSSQAEAVIKIVNNISTARKIALDKKHFENKVIGIIMTNSMPKDENDDKIAELNDLLGRNSFKFVFVSVPLNFKLCKWAMDNYDSAKFFACTHDYLEQFENNIYEKNEYTEDLYNKTENIIYNLINIVSLTNILSYDDDMINKKLKKLEFDENFDYKDDFCRTVRRLQTLFSKSFIRMSEIEKLISNEASPMEGLNKLADIADEVSNMSEQAASIDNIGFTLLKTYYSLLETSPKETELIKLLTKFSNKKIAFIVPKKYFVNIYNTIFSHKFANVECMYPGKFKQKSNHNEEYDMIILSGYISEFDVFQCFSAPDIVLLCYDFEKERFSKKLRKKENIERELNEKIHSQIRESE